MDISTPDNGADKTIVLRISGNRLVSILNALDSLMYQKGYYKLQGNGTVGINTGAQQLLDLTEAVRDELSAQRNGTTAEDVRKSCNAYR